MEIEVFFDGACPRCARAALCVRLLDRRQRIALRDIAEPDFEPTSLGIEWSAFMERMHTRLADGSWATGVEALRCICDALGFGPLVWLTRVRGIAYLLDRWYERLARNRLRLAGRCTIQCGEKGPERI